MRYAGRHLCVGFWRRVATSSHGSSRWFLRKHWRHSAPYHLYNGKWGALPVFAVVEFSPSYHRHAFICQRLPFELAMIIFFWEEGMTSNVARDARFIQFTILVNCCDPDGEKMRLSLGSFSVVPRGDSHAASYWRILSGNMWERMRMDCTPALSRSIE